MDFQSQNSVEAVLRDGKEFIRVLSSHTSNVEQGALVDMVTLEASAEGLLSQLDRLASGVPAASLMGVPSSSGVSSSLYNTSRTHPGGAINPVLTPQNISSYSQGVARTGVPTIQKRKAEALSTEIRQTLEHLRRCCTRNESKAMLIEKKRQLMGSAVPHMMAGRTEYDVLDLQNEERKRLEYLNRRFQHIEQESHEVLQALQKQGSRLIGSQNKIGTLMDSLGLGDTTLGKIIKRNKMDAYIVYVGVILLFFVMWIIWRRVH